jgi:hypothetical protein
MPDPDDDQVVLLEQCRAIAAVAAVAGIAEGHIDLARRQRVDRLPADQRLEQEARAAAVSGQQRR